MPPIVDDSNCYIVEKLSKDGVEMFVRGTDQTKVESWIDITKKAFRAFLVPHRHQIRLITCMLQEKHHISGSPRRKPYFIDVISIPSSGWNL